MIRLSKVVKLQQCSTTFWNGVHLHITAAGCGESTSYLLRNWRQHSSDTHQSCSADKYMIHLKMLTMTFSTCLTDNSLLSSTPHEVYDCDKPLMSASQSLLGQEQLLITFLSTLVLLPWIRNLIYHSLSNNVASHLLN